MKAKEAPEKLYFFEGEPILSARLKKLEGTAVEYIRTDAFIEKAVKWLMDNLQTIRDGKSLSKHHVETIPALGSITQTEFWEKFKKEVKYLFD